MTRTMTLGPPENAFTQEMRGKEKEITKRLVTDPPPGERYEALVPDTLDLAERCALALNGHIETVEPDLEYVQYGMSSFDGNPACMRIEMGTMNMGKTVEALPQVRLASGSAQALDRERGLMLRVMAQSWDDGVFYAAPAEGRPWIDPQYAERADMGGIGRMLHGMLCWYQYNGDPLWMEQAHKAFRTVHDKLVRYDDEGNAFFPPPSRDWGHLLRSGYPADLPESGHPDAYRSSHSEILSYNLLGMAKYAAMTGDREALELAGKMANTLRTRKFWEKGFGFIETAGIVAEERAHFYGHGQTNLMALRGLLEYGEAANDADVKEFVRSGYELWRCYGIADIGFFPEDLTGAANGEGCCAASMTILAIRLSQSGVGDYWEDVERYVRNTLTEWQFTDRAQLERCCAASEPREARRPGETNERVIERSLGSFCGNPFVTDYPRPGNAECCNQNGAQALYQAWEAIVQDKGEGTAQINLLLNRSSAQLDLDSYLPYEGKAVIRNKRAERIFVRIPNWVSRGEVRCRVDASAVANHWLNNYLVFESLQPAAGIVIEFPVVERTIKKTLGVTGTTYTIQLRGNTVMDISPRDEQRPQGLQDGALMLSRRAVVTVAGLELKDGQVTVDADSRRHGCGIVLRHRNYWDYLAAYYNRAGERIYFIRMAAGIESLVGSIVSAKDLGPAITLRVRLEGTQAGLTVSDGEKTFTVTGEIPELAGVPGGVGVFVGRHTRAPQWYKNFRVSSLEGETIFEDRLDGPNGAPAGWQGANQECNYLFYQRDHMRREKAPMVKKTRFVPDHVIKP